MIQVNSEKGSRSLGAPDIPRERKETDKCRYCMLRLTGSHGCSTPAAVGLKTVGVAGRKNGAGRMSEKFFGGVSS